jgi:hypothetical protein
VSALRWTLATTAGFALGGVALHSPGASAVGSTYLDFDASAATFGAFLGTLVGLVTGLLQLIARRTRELRLVGATVVAVAIAHALADGAPAIWGVPVVAALSGLAAAAAFAWATNIGDVRMLAIWFAAWTGGWLGGVSLAGALGLSGGGTPEVWAAEHLVIGASLGLAWGLATTTDVRHVVERRSSRRSG